MKTKEHCDHTYCGICMDKGKLAERERILKIMKRCDAMNYQDRWELLERELKEGK